MLGFLDRLFSQISREFEEVGRTCWGTACSTGKATRVARGPREEDGIVEEDSIVVHLGHVVVRGTK